MSVTDEVKTRLDIVEIIGASVPLRKVGRTFVGFCPFHPNTRTPAFTVYPDSQSYHCFGCKASGDVFTFTMQRQGLEFRDALEQLAQRAGVTLEPRTPVDEQQDQQRTRLLEVNAAAAKYFNYVLLSHRGGQPGRDYVARRGINDATIEAFQLGFSLPEWSHLLSYLTDKKGFEIEEVEAAGLAIHRDSGGYYDRFRGRVIFPIRNAKGETVAFGGRALADEQPKYLNSPQTALFDKSNVLYGLDLARSEIRARDAVVIVEGYVDVLTAHQYGFRNVVAPLGTALTEGHVALLKKLSRNIFLALDADAAGQKATLRGLSTLTANLDGRDVPVPTPEGTIRWARELEGSVRVIAMPDGLDPDEVIRADGGERW
ncbi:MAG: DNA primase, partial [Chloroflexales bacterium]|nr:DNA primase [Chloroflexales bacterium]